MRHAVHEDEQGRGEGKHAGEDRPPDSAQEEERDSGQSKDKRDEGGEEDDRKPQGHQDPDQEEGDGDKNDKKGFKPSRKAIVIAVIVVALLLVAGLFYWLHARQFVTTDDAYTAGHVHEVSVRVPGTVEAVLVDDNQTVRAGDILLRLDRRDYDVAVDKARAGVKQAQAQTVQAQAKIAQSRAQYSAAGAQVGQAQAQLAQAGAQLEKARSDYDRVAGLYSKDIKAVSKADVDAATEAFDRARSAVEGARANVLAVQAQVEAAEASVKAAEADASVAAANVTTSEVQVRDAELQLSYCDVIASVDGKVSKKTVEEGQRLQPGQALMAIVPDDVWVIANLKETQLDRLQTGQRVDITIDSLKHRTFFGSVDSIQNGSGATFSLLPPDNATGNFTKIVQRVPVKIVFDPESIRDFRDKIVPGLSVEPRIDLESLRDNAREPKRQKREQKQNREAESGS